MNMQLRAWMRDSYTLGSIAVALADLFIDAPGKYA